LSRAAIQQGDREAAAVALEAARGFGDEQPEAFEPAPFVGSARCAECHPEVHRYEQAGRHARTFHPANDLRHIPLPEPPWPDPNDPRVSHSLRRSADRIAIRMKVGSRELEAVLDYVLGSGKHAYTPVGHDDGGRPLEWRFSYYAEIGAWDCSPGHPVRP